MEFFDEVFSLDNVLGIVLLYLGTLQHLRATKRDAFFFDTQNRMIELLSDCQEHLPETPRN